MKIKTVHYSALINLGDYSNEKIGFTAEVEEDDSIDEIIESLKAKVEQVGGLNAQEFYSKQRDGRHALVELEREIKQATEQWNATSEFLRTQGIKPDTPVMPAFTNLLPEVKEERSGVIDGEIEETDQIF
jgi:hypothetical protein